MADPTIPEGDFTETPAAAEPAAEPDPVRAADKARHRSDIAKTQADLKKQKKVVVRVQEDTYVGINGYGFRIKGKTKVEVPEQVADILEEAGRI